MFERFTVKFNRTGYEFHQVNFHIPAQDSLDLKGQEKVHHVRLVGAAGDKQGRLAVDVLGVQVERQAVLVTARTVVQSFHVLFRVETAVEQYPSAVYVTCLTSGVDRQALFERGALDHVGKVLSVERK